METKGVSAAIQSVFLTWFRGVIMQSVIYFARQQCIIAPMPTSLPGSIRMMVVTYHSSYTLDLCFKFTKTIEASDEISKEM